MYGRINHYLNGGYERPPDVGYDNFIEEDSFISLEMETTETETETETETFVDDFTEEQLQRLKLAQPVQTSTPSASNGVPHSNHSPSHLTNPRRDSAPQTHAIDDNYNSDHSVMLRTPPKHRPLRRTRSANHSRTAPTRGQRDHLSAMPPPMPIIRPSRSSLNVHRDAHHPPFPLRVSVPIRRTSQPSSTHHNLMRQDTYAPLAHNWAASGGAVDDRPVSYVTPEIRIPTRWENENDISKAFIIAADRSPKRNNSWNGSLAAMKDPSILPKWTKQIFGFLLLLNGVVGIILGPTITSNYGKSQEISLAIFSSILITVLGFHCLWIQKWPRHPNRNYISSYAISTILSTCQSICLGLLENRKYFPKSVFLMVTVVLYCVTFLIVTFATSTVYISCCWKETPLDNRVTPRVDADVEQGFIAQSRTRSK